MIYITGDCHGSYRRFTKKRFPKQLTMSKQDYVIVCGDFGLWDRSQEQEHYRKWLGLRNFTLLWVDGNHENYDMLKKYKIVEWKGGKVQFINPSIIHLMRGQIYEIDGLKIFTFGGARCHDIQGGILELEDEHLAEKSSELDRMGIFYRVNHESWWAEEMPSKEEREEGIRNLIRYQNEVDYIITHCAPTSIQNYFTEGDYLPDELTDYLEGLKGSIKFRKWYFGHYHDNRIIEEKFCLLYKHIELLDNNTEAGINAENRPEAGGTESKIEGGEDVGSKLSDGNAEMKAEGRSDEESRPGAGSEESKSEDRRDIGSKLSEGNEEIKPGVRNDAGSKLADENPEIKPEDRSDAESRQADINAEIRIEGSNNVGSQQIEIHSIQKNNEGVKGHSNYTGIV